MDAGTLMAKLGWPADRSAHEGLARWSGPSEDGSSTLEAAVGREDGLVMAVLSHLASDGEIEGLVMIEAQVESGQAVPRKCHMGDPPCEVSLEDAVKLFEHMRRGLGEMAFEAGDPIAAPASAKA